MRTQKEFLVKHIVRLCVHFQGHLRGLLLIGIITFLIEIIIQMALLQTRNQILVAKYTTKGIQVPL